jgi:U2 small nuclear ribonucleoprotein B''
MALQTPSLTLYVSNLEGKTKKPELKASLYSLFTPYGRVWVLYYVYRRGSTDDRVDIVAKKNGGGREQAFVVFEEQTAATAALRGLSGQLFYKKALVRPL